MWTSIFLFLCTIGFIKPKSTSMLISCAKPVKSCPIERSQWIQKTEHLKCTNDYGYVCLRDLNGYLFETCMANFSIQVNLGNCPILFACLNNKPYLGKISTFYRCPMEVSGCPPKNHTQYSIHQLYKYPKCVESNFSDVIGNISSRFTASISMTTITTGHINEEDNGHLIAIVVSIVLLIVVGWFIGYIVFLRKRRYDIVNSRKKNYDYSKVTKGKIDYISEERGLSLCCCRKHSQYYEARERYNEKTEKYGRNSLQKVRKDEVHQPGAKAIETQDPPLPLNENEVAIDTRNRTDSENNYKCSFLLRVEEDEGHQHSTEVTETQEPPSPLYENEGVIYARNWIDPQKLNIVNSKSMATRDADNEDNEKDQRLKEAQVPLLQPLFQASNRSFSTLQEEERAAPGQPMIVHVTSDSVEITWVKPYDSVKIDYFEIRYRNVKESHWESKKTEDGETNGAMVDYLNALTQYRFKVRAVCNDNEGPYSPISEVVETRQSLPSMVKTLATKIQQENPEKYKIPIREISNYRYWKTRCVVADLPMHEDPRCVIEKTIMLIGNTGAGKSTLVDALVDYILGVSFNDDFRFSLVDLTHDEMLRSGDQTISQQDWITNYKIPCLIDSRISYTLNVIDTPGIADTDAQHYKYIIQQIKSFFHKRGEHGINEINAICFVTPASLVRITPAQRYIFDIFLSVFGQDIMSNIVIMATFSDGSDPSVLQALTKADVPFRKHFVFNNSALYSKQSETFTKNFWQMGWNSFNLFFEELGIMETQSLQLTLEVLKMRGELENAVSIVMPRISYILDKINERQHHKEQLEKYIDKIEQNRPYKYRGIQLKHIRIPLPHGKIVTNCKRCEITCHEGCTREEISKLKGRCKVLGRSGICQICKCESEHHAQDRYIIRVVEEVVNMTYQDMLQRYQSAIKGKQETSHTLSRMNYELNRLQKEVRETIRQINSWSNKLKEIALKQNPLSDVQYTELLIDSENKNQKPGYLKRIEVLRKVKGHADFTSRVQQKPSIDMIILETFV